MPSLPEYAMRFQNFVRSDHLTLGLFGLDRHGKTTLANALSRTFGPSSTSILGKRPAESYGAYEPVRITARKIECMADGVTISVVDFGARDDSIKSMVRGLVELDGAILVVDATTGPLPEAWDVLRLARILQVPPVIVFISKTDLVDDPEYLDLIEAEVREILRARDFANDGMPVVRGSALLALRASAQDPEDPARACIRQLLEAMRAYVRPPATSIEQPLLLPVEDVFDLPGRGRIVVGRIERGTVKPGDHLDLVGMSTAVRQVLVTGLETHRKKLERGVPGEHLSCLLQGVEREQLAPGQVLAAPGSIAPHTVCKAWIYLCTRHECGISTYIFTDHPCPLSFYSTNVAGSLILLEGREMALPGDILEVRIALSVPVALERGTRFAVRKWGQTIGFGVVTEPE